MRSACKNIWSYWSSAWFYLVTDQKKGLRQSGYSCLCCIICSVIDNSAAQNKMFGYSSVPSGHQPLGSQYLSSPDLSEASFVTSRFMWLEEQMSFVHYLTNCWGIGGLQRFEAWLGVLTPIAYRWLLSSLTEVDIDIFWEGEDTSPRQIQYSGQGSVLSKQYTT